MFSGYESPSDWPWTYALLVSEARRIISYFELPKKAQPPKSIWHSIDKCGDFIDKNLNNSTKESPSFLEFDEKELEHANR